MAPQRTPQHTLPVPRAPSLCAVSSDASEGLRHRHSREVAAARSRLLADATPNRSHMPARIPDLPVLRPGADPLQAHLAQHAGRRPDRRPRGGCRHRRADQAPRLAVARDNRSGVGGAASLADMADILVQTPPPPGPTPEAVTTVPSVDVTSSGVSSRLFRTPSRHHCCNESTASSARRLRAAQRAIDARSRGYGNSSVLATKPRNRVMAVRSLLSASGDASPALTAGSPNAHAARSRGNAVGVAQRLASEHPARRGTVSLRRPSEPSVAGRDEQ
jgi:hypothetical protein